MLEFTYRDRSYMIKTNLIRISEKYLVKNNKNYILCTIFIYKVMKEIMKMLMLLFNAETDFIDIRTQTRTQAYI